MFMRTMQCIMLRNKTGYTCTPSGCHVGKTLRHSWEGGGSTAATAAVAPSLWRTAQQQPGVGAPLLNLQKKIAVGWFISFVLYTSLDLHLHPTCGHTANLSSYVVTKWGLVFIEPNGLALDWIVYFVRIRSVLQFSARAPVGYLDLGLLKIFFIGRVFSQPGLFIYKRDTAS
jgi:hypothetical protein